MTEESVVGIFSKKNQDTGIINTMSMFLYVCVFVCCQPHTSDTCFRLRKWRLRVALQVIPGLKRRDCTQEAI